MAQNLLERSLGEVKRRTKVMGRFPGEDSCLTLVWAVLVERLPPFHVRSDTRREVDAPTLSFRSEDNFVPNFVPESADMTLARAT